jgi:hypothetical protein
MFHVERFVLTVLCQSSCTYTALYRTNENRLGAAPSYLSVVKVTACPKFDGFCVEPPKWSWLCLPVGSRSATCSQRSSSHRCMLLERETRPPLTELSLRETICVELRFHPCKVKLVQVDSIVMSVAARSRICASSGALCGRNSWPLA